MLSPNQPSTGPLERLGVRVQRLGAVLTPNGSPAEVGGILNPGAARSPAGDLLVYPRCVAEANVSRVGTVRVLQEPGGFVTERLGFALEPEAPYELRAHPGFGCEDPRVTYIPVLKAYVMAYTAFGPDGPRIAIAVSDDAYRWERLGLAQFAASGSAGDDKDAAFFPEPVTSPQGHQCLAFYHRPMLHMSSVDGRAAIPMIERIPFEDRESIKMAYVPLDPVLKDRRNLCNVSESVQVLSPDQNWGSIKIGAGTPPVRVKIGGTEGWLAFFHGVDSVRARGRRPSLRYSAGIVIHDFTRPDHILYRAPGPILTPESNDELRGVVDNVVFPTGLDPRPDLGEHVYDVYYGMGDYSVGAARVWVEEPSPNG